MKTVAGGWEFVTLQTVRSCAPIQTDRVRTRIVSDGVVREVDREVWERDPNAGV